MRQTANEDLNPAQKGQGVALVGRSFLGVIERGDAWICLKPWLSL